MEKKEEKIKDVDFKTTATNEKRMLESIIARENCEEPEKIFNERCSLIYKW